MADQNHGNELPFAESAGRVASDHDVLMCYQLLLGRDPENSFVIQEAKTQQLRWIFEGFVQSGEFDDKVRRPFNQSEPLAHDTETIGPSAEQLTWLKQSLKTSRRTTSAIMASRSWRALFAALFSLPGFTTEPQQTPTQLLGAVESLTGSQVKGWCVDAAGSASAVTLLMLADGDAIGRCECQLLRPDVQMMLGGDGRCGFEFDIPESLREQGFVLSAQDAASGVPVLGPLHMPTSSAALFERVAVLQDRAGRIDNLMRQVAGELPSLASDIRSLAAILSAPADSPAPQTGLTDINKGVERVGAGL